MRHKSTVLIAAVISVSTIRAIPALAYYDITNYRYSTEATAGSYHEEGHEYLYGSIKRIDSGHTGYYIYGTGVGLPNAFVDDDSRRIIIKLYEADYGIDDLASTSEFVFDSTSTNNFNHYYQPDPLNPINYPIQTGALLETDGVVEMYLKFRVQHLPGDSSYTIPSSLFSYRLWVD
jgi:hypothetical protein